MTLCDKNLPTVLANSSNHSRARRHNIVSKTFTVNVIFCPLKANTWRLKVAQNSFQLIPRRSKIFILT